MFQKFVFVTVALLIGVYFLASTPAQDQDAKFQQPDSWRHLALSTKDHDDLQLAQQINELGADGWQLVDVENFVSAGEIVKSVYYFKRPG